MRSPKRLAIVLCVSVFVGVFAALAAAGIVTLTGSEPLSPLAGGVMGAAVGLSAGAVIGRSSGQQRVRPLETLLQAIAAGGAAALTLLVLQSR